MFTGIITDIGIVVSPSSSRAEPVLSRVEGRDLASFTLTIHAPKTARRLKPGSSVAIDGCCTTIEQLFPERTPTAVGGSPTAKAGSRSGGRRATQFTVRLMPITKKLTTLGSLKPGDRVNLEHSLRVGDDLGGHFVLGHVDGIGIIGSSRLGSSARGGSASGGNNNPHIPPYHKGEERGLRSQYSSSDPAKAGESRSTLLSIKVPPLLRKYITPRGSIAVDGISLTVVSSRANVFTVSLVDYTLKHTALGQKKVGDKVNIEVDPLARYALQ